MTNLNLEPVVIAIKQTKLFIPERILLFGSQATGTATQYSDVDLCITVNVDREETYFPDLDLERQLERELRERGINAGSGKGQYSVRIITEYELTHREGLVAADVARDGKEIYNRQEG